MRHFLIGLVCVSTSVFLAAACGGSNRTGSAPVADGGKEAATFTDSGTSSRGAPETCEGAAQNRSYIGCDYWPTVLGNTVWEVFDFAVVVANTQDKPAEVTITGPNGVDETAKIAAGGLKKFYLPWVEKLKGAEGNACGGAPPLTGSVLAKGGAYHLVSSIPVTVFQFNALEYKGQGGPAGKSWASCLGNKDCVDPDLGNVGPIGCFSFTNDASLLLPSTAWTGNYRIATQRGSGPEGPGSMGGYFSVAASQDDTEVSVTLPRSETILPGAGITGTSKTLTFSLAAGDVAQIVGTGGDAHDLSGALVQSNKPVQVISGTPCSVAGAEPSGQEQLSCDHLEESVFPAETLGKRYVVAPPTSPKGAVVGHIVRFYGNADDTNLTYAPKRPAGCPATLNAGEVFECTGTVAEPFEVTGDHEFIVGTFMLSGYYQDSKANVQAGEQRKGDPSQSFATAVEQFRGKYIFLAPNDYDENWVDIIVPDDTDVTVDDEDVTEKPRAIANGFSVIRHKLGDGEDGAHTLSASKPVGIQVMGFGAYTSYHYPGGLDLNQIAPPPVK